MFKKYQDKLGAKVFAIIFLCVLVALGIACALGSYYVYEMGWYTRGNGIETSLDAWLSSVRYILPVGAFACLILCVVDFVFLLCSAGRKEGVEGIRKNFIDVIPLDLYAALVFLACGLMLSAFFEFPYMLVMIVLSGLLCLSLCMTFATRVKLGGWWKGTLTYIVLAFTGRCLKKLGGWLVFAARGLPMLGKWLFIAVGALLTFFLLALSARHSLFAAVSLLAFSAFIVFSTAVLAREADAIQKGTKKLVTGELGNQIDTRYMHWDFKTHAEALNSIADGMNLAVAGRMKSERMKTDLITNVSHDLKTPLTSIINYVDLLKREGVAGEKANEYVAVIDRQAQRLKKLTEDLVEASKAQSGALNVALAPTQVKEIAEQSVAEYAERLAAAKLTPIVDVESGLTVLADGRLYWRVLDNLLSNVCKYALEGTRVYIDAVAGETTVTMTVKNVSRDPLNISPEELTERFVRGDASRSREGSGLGLSIAQSLTELMGGTFSLDVDGDLFKAKVELKGAEKNQ